MIGSGQLSKLTILAFKDKKGQRKESDFKVFEIPINPESYTRSFKSEQEKKSGQGNQGTDPKYVRHAPEEIKLDFYLDGTGTVEGYVKSLEGMKVSQQIELLINTVYMMKGEQHRPAFLKLSWGEYLVFDCILTNLDINYTLFHPNGEPLRAKLSATFLNYIEPKKRVALEDKRSPDLTHVKYVEEDSLPQMCFELYGDSRYYLNVAKANQLTSFRNIPADQRQLVFPPFKKTNN